MKPETWLQARPTNTGYERLGLTARVNLCDGHARLPLSLTQQAIIDSLPELFRSSAAECQSRLERDFVNEFFRLARQPMALTGSPVMLSYSASSAIQMLSTLLRGRGARVALIEPCFDNIPRLLQSSGNTVHALSEDVLDGDCSGTDIISSDLTALWITAPNNPTGRVVTPSSLSTIAKMCRDAGVILVCDMCFRFFSDEILSFDQYRILRESGVSFAVIEDTGKTWSTVDVKVGILTCSDDLFPHLYALHDDLLLNVSPFHLAFLTKFIRDSAECGLTDAIRAPIEVNRRIVHALICETGLCDRTTDSDCVPFEWLRLTGEKSATQLWTRLRKKGVEILPGGNFFWTQLNKGDEFVRIPLSRAAEVIRSGTSLLVETMRSMDGKRR